MIETRIKTRRALLFLCGWLALVLPIVAAPTFNQSLGGGRHGYASRNTKLSPSINYRVRVHLLVLGADGDQERAIQAALSAAQVKVKFHERKDKTKPSWLVVDFDRRSNLTQLINVLQSATPPRPGVDPPAYELTLYASLDKDSSTKAIAKLANLSGVDSAKSAVDEASGELHIRLTGNGTVTLDDVTSCLRESGVTATFSKKDLHKSKAPGQTNKIIAWLSSWFHSNKAPVEEKTSEQINPAN